MTEELAGSNGSSHGIGQGNNCSRTFIVPWADRLGNAHDLLGTAHPEIPFCWCGTVKIEPFPSDPKAYGGDITDATTEGISYDLAKLTAEYITDFSIANQWPNDIPKPTIRAGTTLQIAVRAAGEFMRFPARHTRWEDNTTGDPYKASPEGDSPAGCLLVHQGEITLTWNYLDDPPIATLDTFMGKVNSAAFLGKSAESLLFTGYELSEATRASAETPGCWTVRITLQHREILIGAQSYGWNYEYRGADGWKKVKVFDGANWVDRYAMAVMSSMFT